MGTRKKERYFHVRVHISGKTKPANKPDLIIRKLIRPQSVHTVWKQAYISVG